MWKQKEEYGQEDRRDGQERQKNKSDVIVIEVKGRQKCNGRDNKCTMDLQTKCLPLLRMMQHIMSCMPAILVNRLRTICYSIFSIPYSEHEMRGFD